MYDISDHLYVIRQAVPAPDDRDLPDESIGAPPRPGDSHGLVRVPAGGLGKA